MWFSYAYVFEFCTIEMPIIVHGIERQLIVEINSLLDAAGMIAVIALIIIPLIDGEQFTTDLHVEHLNVHRVYRILVPRLTMSSQYCACHEIRAADVIALQLL